MDFVNRIILGDCEEVLREFPDNSVDLIFTSPPYADQRKRTYGGVTPDEYTDWFLPKAQQFLRLKGLDTELFLVSPLANELCLSDTRSIRHN